MNYSSNDDINNSSDDDTSNSSNNTVREPILTGEKIGKSVLDILQNNEINMEYCVGISTDNCKVMASEKRGAVSVILKKSRSAVWISCKNHCLNLSLCKSSNIQSVRK